MILFAVQPAKMHAASFQPACHFMVFEVTKCSNPPDMPASRHIALCLLPTAGINLLSENNALAGVLLNAIFLLGTFSFAVILGVVSDDISSEVKVGTPGRSMLCGAESVAGHTLQFHTSSTCIASGMEPSALRAHWLTLRQTVHCLQASVSS